MSRERTRVERRPARAAEVRPQPATATPAPAPPQSVTSSAAAASAGHTLNDISILSPEQTMEEMAKASDGAQVPQSIRRRAESGLGVSLDDARVHEGPGATSVASHFAAKAVTLGSDIYLADRTALGNEGLMAHELVHVAQQRGDPAASALAPSAGDVSLAEREASRAAASLVMGIRPPAVTLGALPRQAYAAPDDPAPQPVGPADVNIGFNPTDILHRLLLAIDQKQVTMHGVVSLGDLRDGTDKWVRHIDYSATVAALTNLTADEVKEVKRLYQQHEDGRSMETDIFGGGESDHPSDLTKDQLTRVAALLGGTKAGAHATAEEVQDAEGRKHRAEAVEIHELLLGDLGKDEVQHLLAMLRRNAEVNAAVGTAYEQLYHEGLSNAIWRLAPAYGVQATKLLAGKTVEADMIMIGLKQGRIQNLDKEIAELTEKSKETLSRFTSAIGPDITGYQIKELQKDRAQAVDELEQLLQQSIAESRAEVIKQGGSAEAVEAAARGRATAVLGDVNAAATLVGGTDTAVVRAMVADDPVGKAVADLRKSAAADNINAAQINTTLRGLRDQAETRAKLENPKATPDEQAGKAKIIAEGYFNRLRSSYDELAGTEMHFDKLLADTGKDGDAALNETLFSSRGRLGDIQEIIWALTGDRKDTEAVERVLKNKSAVEIKLLKQEYVVWSGGRSLEFDLFGEAPTTADGENPEVAGGYLLAQGKAKDTSRLNLEDYFQRPSEEGGLEEVNYIIARAEREFEYTIDNRGATGAWRDTWGNEQRDLLDETIKEARGLHQQYLFATMQSPQWPHTPAAHQILEKMRLARATIRGDRAAYEKATAELRATFEAIAAFALQIALTAVLGPIAEAALIGELAEGASVALRVAKAAQTAIVGTASTIGANLATYGTDYSLAMLKSDLLGGLGGALGPAGVDKLMGPYARSLVSKLGPKASQEILALAKTVAGMETTSALQGQSLDLSLEAVGKAHLGGKVGEHVNAKVKGAMTGGEHAGAPASGEPAAAPEPTPAPAPAPADSTSGAASPAAPAAAKPVVPLTVRDLAQAPAAAAPAAAPTAPVTAAANVPKALPPASAPAVVEHAPAAVAHTPAVVEHAPAVVEHAPAVVEHAPAVAEHPPGAANAPKPAAAPEAGSETPLRKPPKEGAQAPAAGKVRDLGLAVHPEMPNVLIDKSIPEGAMKALLAELELTPTGSRIADRIRNGEVEVVLTSEPIAKGTAGLALDKEIQVTWEGSIEETASTMLHEGAHHLDPVLEHNGVPDSMLSREALARVEEYEYRIRRRLPPSDAAEQAYRDAMLGAISAGRPPADVRLAAERAMIDAMRADPDRYGVETAAQERARMQKPPAPDGGASAAEPAPSPGAENGRPAETTGSEPRKAPLPPAKSPGDPGDGEHAGSAEVTEESLRKTNAETREAIDAVHALLEKNPSLKGEFSVELKKVRDDYETIKKDSSDPGVLADHDLRNEADKDLVKVRETAKVIALAIHEKLAPPPGMGVPAEILDKATHVAPADYSRGKHWQGTTDAERTSSSEGGPGQFMISMDASRVAALERETLSSPDTLDERGSGTYHAYKKFPYQIGWADGKPAFTLRAELSAGSIHSHPRPDE